MALVDSLEGGAFCTSSRVRLCDFALGTFDNPRAVGRRGDTPTADGDRGHFHAYARFMRISTVCLAFAISALASTQARGQCTYDELVPSLPAQIQWFGASIALDGDRLLVGAPKQDAGGLQWRGFVYAFTRDAATGLWLETQRLVPSIQLDRLGFGFRVEIAGDLAVVTAPIDGFFSPGDGYVFVFAYDTATGTWNETQSISVPGAYRFGASVLLRDEELFVTADPNGSMSAPRVYAYERDSITGQFAPTQLIAAPATAPTFGWCMDRVGPDCLLVSAATTTVSGLDRAGVIAVFKRGTAGGSWNLVDQLLPPDPHRSGVFGASFEWDARQLVVGQRTGSGGFPGDGAAFVFERDTAGVFLLVQRIDRPGGYTAFNHFGMPRALDDGELLLTDNIHRWGATRPLVRRYQRDETSGHWHYADDFVDPVRGGHTDFGNRADFDRGRIAFGAAWSSVSGSPQGRAFVFDAEECGVLGSTYCTPPPAHTQGLPAELALRGSRLVANQRLIASATNLPVGAASLLLAGRAPGSMAIPGAVGPLCIAGPLSRFVDRVHAASGAGSVRLALDVNSFPSPAGPLVVQPGDTWCFQVWYRDMGSSGFTDAVRLVMQ